MQPRLYYTTRSAWFSDNSRRRTVPMKNIHIKRIYKGMPSFLSPTTIMIFYLMFGFFLANSPAFAHHVLGRPSYSLNEDSNTPPSMQVETQIGEYYVTYMIFPAFPRPTEAGRVNLYATRIDNGQLLNTEVTFNIKDDSWFSSRKEILGIQKLDDNVYRQGFIFQEKGDYTITAEFESGGEPYMIDFPLRIGKPNPVGPIGGTIGAVVIFLFVISMIKRKRSKQMRSSRSTQAIKT